MLRQKLGVLVLVATFIGMLAFMVYMGGKLKEKEQKNPKEKDDKDKERVN